MENNSNNILGKYKFDEKIKEKIRKLCSYNDCSGVIALLADYAIIAFAIYFSEINLFWYPLTILLIGSRQRALATILHESAHKTLSKNRKLNRILGTYLSGYQIFQTFDAYSRSHVINHHVKLGDTELDPDFKHYKESGIFKEKNRSTFIGKYLFKPILCLNIYKTVRYLLINRLLNTENKSEFIRMLFSIVFFSALGTAIVGWKFYLIYWLIPYLTTFQIITWFIELAEHYPLVQHAQYDLYATRNRFSHFIESLFTSIHGENFHLIHHLFPGVPFWKMEKAHEILLNDPEYARINASFGGIFLSGNYVKSMWHKIIVDFDRVNHAV
ncbi:MAG: guanitoxin biosynthesis L-arginine gamma (S) hydroxylase [Burkholderiaceae bacterium]